MVTVWKIPLKLKEWRFGDFRECLAYALHSSQPGQLFQLFLTVKEFFHIKVDQIFLCLSWLEEESNNIVSEIFTEYNMEFFY